MITLQYEDGNGNYSPNWDITDGDIYKVHIHGAQRMDTDHFGDHLAPN